MGANYFVVFVFRINRKEAIDFKKMTLSLRLLLVWEERSPNLFPFPPKKKSWGQSSKLNFQKSIFLVILKVSLLNNIKIKNRIWNKVVNTVSPISSCAFRAFSIVSSSIRKSNKVCWPYINQSTYHVLTLKMVAYRKTNKNELSKDTSRRKVYLSFM